MSINSVLKKLLSLYGNDEFRRNELRDEVDALNSIMSKSLKIPCDVEEISPTIILKHTESIKKNISLYLERGVLNDESSANYVISNIEDQERMIQLSDAAYKVGDVEIYASQVGASISEILKDISLLKLS